MKGLVFGRAPFIGCLRGLACFGHLYELALSGRTRLGHNTVLVPSHAIKQTVPGGSPD